MQYLIDTQVMLWQEENPDKLSSKAASLFLSADSLLLSKASVWELVIKFSLGKIKLDKPIAVFINDFLKDYSVELMDISLDDILQIEKLPPIHKDPFDRLIIAQSIVKNIPLISADSLLDQYPIQRIW